MSSSLYFSLKSIIALSIVLTQLFFNVRGICGGDQDIMPLIETLISPLVRGYTDLYNKQKNLKKLQDGKKDEFFGLRDFYRYDVLICNNSSN